MGDMGSLTLGATLAVIAVITSHEVSLFLIGGIFIIETISVIMQVSSYTLFHKRVFLMTPIHHHFEKLGWNEQDIVRLFLAFGLILSMAGIFFGVWL